MQARFLLGPAGSGKTHRCLVDIRAELAARPDGRPLILLAPKQATFQLERQLLSGGELAGYTRLRIFSFERLAEFVLASLRVPLPRQLTEEGRLMVLRALLAQQADQLELFRASARLPGFARQLNLVLRELQHHQLRPRRLEELAARATGNPHLQSKLRDLARLLGAYLEWLQAHRLQDTDVLLDFAAEVLGNGSDVSGSGGRDGARIRLLSPPPHPAFGHPLPRSERGRGKGEGPLLGSGVHGANLGSGNSLPEGEGRGEGKGDAASDCALSGRSGSKCGFQLGGLWLDGFAEMTPQELHLLSAVLPRSDHAQLAFCLESEPREELPWLSTWSVVSQTFRECRRVVSALADVSISVEIIRRDSTHGRFVAQPMLAHLEANWTIPRPFEGIGAPNSNSAGGNEVRVRAGSEIGAPIPLRLVSCRDAEAEAVIAAHEILRYVRERGGRFRDCAVLLRSLEGYHDVFRRAFARRDIPFFLDRREPVSHHPLAELTRFSLRLAAYGWQHDDWFGALKTSLVSQRETEVDRLENAALEFGWGGDAWRRPLNVASRPEIGEWAEPLRLALVPPFLALADRVRGEVNGRELALALRELWNSLRVEATIEAWSSEASAAPDRAPAVHGTVWEQMQVWLENLELAFPTHPMRLNDWLPILEAGLANLSVGVIPPALDQVLIGTVDRSRNPELQLVILPGFNETVFPAPNPASGLLTEPERDALAGLGARLGPGTLRRIGHERYYGYIACTRARQRVVVTYSQRDGEDRELRPSTFVSDLKRLFPALIHEQTDESPVSWLAAEHASELIAPLLHHAQVTEATGNAATRSERSSESVPDQDLPSPHPSPLPRGEGESGPARERASTSDRSPEVCPPVPSPRGEGQGEGKGDVSHHSGVAQLPSEDDKLASLISLPGLERVRELLERLPCYPEIERLSPSRAEALYLRGESPGLSLRSSVSRLETFAACPFRFFVEVGLRAQERKRFEVDQRERGTLQHDLLERFHQEVTRDGRRWRDISPEDAAELIGRLVDESAATYRGGLFVDDEKNQFTAATLKEALQRFIRVVIGWMRSYQLDPTFVESGFGMEGATLPAWRIPLAAGRELALHGKVDRVDLGSRADGTPWCVVLDYKSGAKKLDPLLLHHGLQLQLPAYLATIESFAREGRIEGCTSVRPAGMFYANLRGAPKSGNARDEVLRRDDSERAAAYRHFGRFNADAIAVLDATAATSPSGQFNFKLKKDGTPGAQQSDPMTAHDFAGLLEDVRAKLGEFGQRILAGEAAVDPYRQGQVTACDHCDHRAVCRIDSRTHRFRALALPPKTAH